MTSPEPPLISSTDDLESHLGQRVRLRGVAGHTKGEAYLAVSFKGVSVRQMSRWPEVFEGKTIEVIGTLGRIEAHIAPDIDPRAQTNEAPGETDS